MNRHFVKELSRIAEIFREKFTTKCTISMWQFTKKWIVQIEFTKISILSGYLGLSVKLF